MTLYAYNFNNYLNRKVIKYDNIADYGEPISVTTGVNFIPGNGINTSQVIPLPDDSNSPDYLVCVNEYGEIVSRWYILDVSRNLSSQYTLSLYRDVIADWYDDVVKAPCFIEKAKLSVSDDGIFNSENMTFSRVKQSETLIQDITRCPWIVGYLARNSEAQTINANTNTVIPDYSYESLKNDDGTPAETPQETIDRLYPYAQYNGMVNVVPNNPIEQRFMIGFTNPDSTDGTNNYLIAWDENGQSASNIFASYKYLNEYVYTIKRATSGFPNFSEYGRQQGIATVAKEFASSITSKDWSNFSPSAYLDKVGTGPLVSVFEKEDGKIIAVDNSFYQIHIHRKTVKYQNEKVNPSSGMGQKLAAVAQETAQKGSFTYSASAFANAFRYGASFNGYYCSFTKIQSANVSISIPKERPHPIDAPYDIFCMPLGEVSYTARDGRNATTDAEAMYKVIQDMIVGIPKEKLWDVQLLPFCPLDLNKIATSQTTGLGLINANAWPQGTFIDIADSNNLYGFMAWVTKSQFSISIDDARYQITMPTNPVDFKIAHACDLYRLTSPNYNSMFEFTAAANRGITGYRVDCAYKPFTPYIRVAPHFGGLYGNVQDDCQGLVCSGDFSIPQVNTEWSSYEALNKNYQTMFDRQIENMEIQNHYQQTADVITAMTGTFTGAAAGGVSGAMTGHPAGAAIGAGVGLAVSAAGGVADVIISNKLRKETLDYTKDQFGYQLGNIKARPQTLTKISTFNPNNKIFPILEYYTATEVEKEALASKLKYNGMTVMRIGTMRDFIIPNEPTYIKGKIIRLDDIEVDYMLARAIQTEIDQGVYI